MYELRVLQLAVQCMHVAHRMQSAKHFIQVSNPRTCGDMLSTMVTQ